MSYTLTQAGTPEILYIDAIRRCDVALTDAELEALVEHDQVTDSNEYGCWQCGQLISVCDKEGCKTAC